MTVLHCCCLALRTYNPHRLLATGPSGNRDFVSDNIIVDLVSIYNRALQGAVVVVDRCGWWTACHSSSCFYCTVIDDCYILCHQHRLEKSTWARADVMMIIHYILRKKLSTARKSVDESACFLRTTIAPKLIIND